MSSFQTWMSDLTGMTTPVDDLSQWEFQGQLISSNDYMGDIDADLATVSVKHESLNAESVTVKDDRYNKSTDASTIPSSFGYRLSGSIGVASLYADMEASMIPNYAAFSDESMSQFSTFILTPATSVDQHGNDDTFSSQTGLVEQQQQSTYSELSTNTSRQIPIDYWCEKPERHEQIAYRLLASTADPMTQKEMKKLVDRNVQKHK